MKMRKFFALTAAAAIVAALGFSAEAAEAADRPLTGDKKALVVYFSKTGNTQGVAALSVGRKAEDVIACCRGIQCRNGTSCPDQLAKALKQYKESLS